MQELESRTRAKVQAQLDDPNVLQPLHMTDKKQGSGYSRLYSLPHFANRKVLSLAVGDYHTLAVASGCTCQRARVDAVTECKGVMKCKKGPILLGWGQNNYL